MDIGNMSLAQISRAIFDKKLSAVELNRHCLDIYNSTKRLNAFTEVDEEYVLAQARVVDEKIAANEKIGVLAGIPVGVKDNMTTERYATTCASDCFKGRDVLPRVDSEVVKKLRNSDAVIFGKTNMDEFAMGFSSTNSAYGEVLNPYGDEYSAGGSSGGSAVAVAVGSVLGALGTDTGGSIRQPAANCGVVGFKPTFDSVSREGIFPLSDSLDHAGCLTRTVEDCAVLFGVIKKEPTDYGGVFVPAKPSLKVAYLADFSKAFVDEDILNGFFKSVDALKRLGYIVDGIEFDLSKQIAETYKVLCCTDGVRSFERFNSQFPDAITLDKCRQEVVKRVTFGKKVLAENSAAIESAKVVREKTKEKIADILSEFDVIVSPTTLLCAVKRNEEVPVEKGFTSDLFSIVCNLTGIPAISVPMGKDKNGIPMGFQVMSARDCEADLFKVAFDFERTK